MSNRPGQAHAGPGRVLVARVLLLLTVSFLLAGVALATLVTLGLYPTG